MVKDLFGPKEPARERAKRKWRNNDLSARFKKMKATGEDAEQFRVGDGKKYFANEVPKPSKAPLKEPPKPADIIENDNPKVDRFERKLKKDIREMLNAHKSINVEWYRASIRQQKCRLLLEKLRRLEAGTWSTQRKGAEL
jgi:hypothetical protein